MKQFSEAEIFEAMAALRAAGVTVRDVPSQNTSIQASRNPKLTGEHAKYFAAFENLQHVDLSGNLDAAAILKQVDLLPKVTHLTLNDARITDDDLVHLKKFPGLKQLGIFNTDVKGPGLQHLRHTPQLTSISLPSDVPRDALPFICQLPLLEYCPTPVGLTDDDLRLVGQLTNLKSLSLSRANITAAGLKHLKNLQALDSIDLPYNLPADALAELAALNLKLFYFPHNAGDSELVHFAAMQKLERVTPSRLMTDQGLKILATYPALKFVNLAPCEQLTVEGMRHITNCKTIREIELPQSMTDAALASLSTLPQLEGISMNNSELITPAGIGSLAAAPKLKRLMIGKIATPACITSLQRLPELENLAVFYQGPADLEFVRGLKKLKKLKHLNFAQVQFDGAALELLHELSGLESLMIQQCKLRPEQLEALKKAMPKCRVQN